MTDAVIIDLDSTLADTRQRHHIAHEIRESTGHLVTNDPRWADYSRAHVDDVPVEAVRRLTQNLRAGVMRVFITGRDSSAEDSTCDQLDQWQIPWDVVITRDPEDYALPVHEWKAKAAATLAVEGGIEFLFAVDDWPPVAEEFAKLHIPTMTVLPPGATLCDDCLHQFNK